ncbi:Outer membrane protein TolC [Chryseolinea serpens]|uniref:Outer membrane protein TolC n=1 Tax=Chryseolinea serpens TaxID=947013 RepID=A0A1M5XR10_9BACT|nr:TolC family protein [Chryseolinea serpens]SHI01693.1 Outer membrane protein TolC [Chryseolinea serpens]
MKRRLLTAVCCAIIFSGTVAAQEKIELDQVVALALEQNYDVRLFKTYEQQGSTDDKYSVGVFLPVINATGSRTWNSTDQKQILANGTETQRPGVKSNNLNAGVQLTWTLFDGTKMFATRGRLSEIEAQGELNVKAQMVNTIAQVVNNYYNVVRQEQQLKAILEQMSVSEERVKLADRRLQVGTGAKPELLQAKVDLNAQRTAVLQQETIIQQLKDQLNGLVNMKLPPSYTVTDTIIINLDLKQEDIASNIENTNFSLMSYKKNVDVAAFALRERQGERYPIFNATTSYNYSRVINTLVINDFTLLYNQNKGLTYGFTLSMPIMNGFNNRRNIQQARILIDRQTILYNQQKTLVDVGVKNAFVNYDNAKKVLLIEEENISVAKENLFISLESFKRGVATFIELRTAQQSLADAYNRLINARYLAKIAETELLRLNSGLLK